MIKDRFREWWRYLLCLSWPPDWPFTSPRSSPRDCVKTRWRRIQCFEKRYVCGAKLQSHVIPKIPFPRLSTSPLITTHRHHRVWSSDGIFFSSGGKHKSLKASFVSSTKRHDPFLFKPDTFCFVTLRRTTPLHYVAGFFNHFPKSNYSKYVQYHPFW